MSTFWKFVGCGKKKTINDGGLPKTKLLEFKPSTHLKFGDHCIFSCQKFQLKSENFQLLIDIMKYYADYTAIKIPSNCPLLNIIH